MKPIPARIMVVDHEGVARLSIRDCLCSEGYDVVEASSGRVALSSLASRLDLIITELDLPDMHGVEILKRLRGNGPAVPVLVLSNLGAEEIKLQAFEEGAIDYVTKPFSTREVLARVKVALRHRVQDLGSEIVFAVDDLTVDLVRRIVKLNGVDADLSPKEYGILRLLVQHAGNVLSHAFLLENIWSSKTDPQYLRTYIRQVRKKIEPVPGSPRYIMTVTGVGYRLRAPD